MRTFLEFVVGTIAALFPVVDPIGAVPIFLVLTTGVPASLRYRYALNIARNVVLLLVGTLLVGGSVLRFFGVSLAVVRIAGGIVVFHAAWKAMNSDPKLSEVDNQDAVHRIGEHKDISFMPMTIPLLGGPGAIAVTLGLAAQAGGDLSVPTAMNLLAIATAIGLIGIVIYLSLRSSTLLLKVLGASGIQAMSRLLGLFVMAIGVQLILNGLADWLASLNLLVP
ncbi:MarC family protein [Leptolyngbya sp. CCNP1308]|uniref:MarC family protein n=1 Tax=Leptolyngbya sp. CCNP1308 TaxID=3110255 RepID=UPI002B1FCEE7|nr:MarC family protein [Leptolyngbya sp. CCNP1308]MEA5450065.1 MarC family protein [Leptolyngbya sp. CCNP1308]